MDKVIFTQFSLLSVPFLILGIVFMGKLEVGVEYTNGILTASSILFGIWAFVLAAIKPTAKELEESQKPVNDNNYSKITSIKIKIANFGSLHSTTFFIGLFFLAVNVFFLVLASFGVFSEGIALIFTAVTFFLNIFLLYLTLDNYVFQ